MQAASFPQANQVIHPPPGVSADECEPMNVFMGHDPAGKPVTIACWKMTQQEIEHLLKNGGRLWIWIMGHGMCPIAPVVVSPWEPPAEEQTPAK